MAQIKRIAKKFGQRGAHIVLPGELIGKEVIISYIDLMQQNNNALINVENSLTREEVEDICRTKIQKWDFEEQIESKILEVLRKLGMIR